MPKKCQDAALDKESQMKTQTKKYFLIGKLTSVKNKTYKISTK